MTAPDTRIFDTRMSGCLDVWILGCLDAWMFGCLDVWMLGSPPNWITAHAGKRVNPCDRVFTLPSISLEAQKWHWEPVRCDELELMFGVHLTGYREELVSYQTPEDHLRLRVLSSWNALELLQSATFSYFEQLLATFSTQWATFSYF